MLSGRRTGAGEVSGSHNRAGGGARLDTAGVAKWVLSYDLGSGGIPVATAGYGVSSPEAEEALGVAAMPAEAPRRDLTWSAYRCYVVIVGHVDE